MMKTKEGANTYEHSLNHAIEFFSKAGSMFVKKKSFYGGEETALSLFQKTWIVDKLQSFKLLLWLRDCRGGAGNRSGFRECLKWLAQNDSEWINLNIDWIPRVGRFDDLRVLFDTPCENDAVIVWGEAIKNGNVLASKWADRKNFALKHYLGFEKEGDFRKYLASRRKEHIVEHKMSTNRWNEVEYSHVPSVAMSRYTNAFGRHDSERFKNYKKLLEDGKTTIHSDVLFPHDCVRTVRNGDARIGNAQFEALPNFLEGTDEKIIVLADTSGSMKYEISGSIRSIYISQGMALYCSSKIDKNNPFYKKFIAFESESEFKNWNDMTFAQAVDNEEIFDGACGATRINKALDLILNTAKFFNLKQEQLPTTLLIVSDMQFHASTNDGETEIKASLKKWNMAGYTSPKIVFWNVAGYAGSQDIAFANNVALVSGFSPSILKSIFSSKDFTPYGIMLEALKKYENVVCPN